ncbi:hypothetical protein Zm00014a_037579 [Zea mays]|uniref:Uncharacterized protein n=2 Tax=Zea mays TaxID=4577 RepID=A0A1D6MYZ1_MAIZE|nr:hypothetical protein ZEAMMB73_Zm00001d041888 [Zea mays]PWZ32162.1 hypothetical protein Zm00014a_037579 [Zea mays]
MEGDSVGVGEGDSLLPPTATPSCRPDSSYRPPPALPIQDQWPSPGHAPPLASSGPSINCLMWKEGVMIFCCFCSEKLKEGEDIYIYQGDKSFCYEDDHRVLVCEFIL